MRQESDKKHIRLSKSFWLLIIGLLLVVPLYTYYFVKRDITLLLVSFFYGLFIITMGYYIFYLIRDEKVRKEKAIIAFITLVTVYFFEMAKFPLILTFLVFIVGIILFFVPKSTQKTTKKGK